MPEGEQTFSFIEVLRDVPAFMRERAELEWAEWFDNLSQKRPEKTAKPKTAQQKLSKSRRERMRKLRIKQIFARLREVGEENLDEDEKEELDWARGRREARQKINARRMSTIKVF